MKILIAGGGTGGHVFPGIAVAEEIKRVRPECEVVFVGTRRGLESQAVPEAGFPIRYLAGTGFPRTRWWVWLLVSAGGCALLAVLFNWLKKRKLRTQAP